MLGSDASQNSFDSLSNNGESRTVTYAAPASILRRCNNRPEDRQLFDAVRDNSLDSVRRALAANADPNAANSFGETPLFRASWLGQVETVRILLDNGANPNFRDYKGSTPLIFTSCANTILVLLDAGADPNSADCYGNTPLHTAAWTGEIEVTRILCRSGADIFARNVQGETPLDRCRVFRQKHVATFLIYYYIQTIMKYAYGNNPLQIVLEGAIYTMSDQYHSGLVKLRIGTISMDQMVDLMQNIISIDPTVIQRCNADGELPLQFAIRFKAHSEVLFFLLRRYPHVLAWCLQ